MKKIIVAIMIGLMMGVPTGFALSKVFSDITENQWYFDAVSSLSDKGIVEGYDDGTFRPSNNVNRAELAVMMDRLIDYLEGGQSNAVLEQIDAVQVSSAIPTKNDSYSFGNQFGGDTVSISGNTLKVQVSYGQGCGTEPHAFSLVWVDSFLESNPVQANLYLIHDNKGDTCEAYGASTLEFDLTPLKNSYNQGYPNGDGTIIMHINGFGNETETITYQA